MSASHPRRKSTLALLLAVSVFAIIVRYPGQHEKGVDSFEIHSLAGLVVQSGAMNWLTTPLSYVGMAPMSYPPAVPVDVAAFSMVAGISVETAIMAFSLFLGLLVTWTSFLLGKAAFGHDGAAILTAFLVSTSGGMISLTDWILSTRGTFLAIVPLVLALLLRSHLNAASSTKRDWTLFLVVLSVMMLVHLMWMLFVPLVLIALLFGRILRTQESVLRHKIPERARRRWALLTTLALGAGTAAVLVLEQPAPYGLSAIPDISGGLIPDSLVTRLGVYFGTILGLGILLAPLGLLHAVKVHEHSRRQALMMIVLAFFPILLEPVYGTLVAIAPVLMISALALQAVVPTPERRAGRKTALSFAAVLLAALVIVVAPALITVPRTSAIGCNQGGSIDYQTYNAAVWLRDASPSQNLTFVSDDQLNSYRVNAISGIPSVEPIASIGTLGYPWLSEKAQIKLIPVSDPISSLLYQQTIFSVREWIPSALSAYDYYNGKHTWLLLNNPPGVGPGSAILRFYNVQYAVEICGGAGSVFFSALHQGGYVTYADGMQTIYRVES